MNTMQSIYHLMVAVSVFRLSYAEFTDLENFIRVLGTLDPKQATVNYFNGTVFARRPGRSFQKLFNFEGYNINRKLRQKNGTFLSLSREFGVYRQPNTSQILQVWINPWTEKANEIFYVANDPVNAHLGRAPPLQIMSQYLVYNSDIVLEYPNPLSPDKYSQYSAGPIYDSVELFGFFANLTELKYTQKPGVPATGTWIRKSEYLPWMEMSSTPGSLYYTAMSWKCNDGLTCIADDIMKLINTYYPKYKDAPTEEEVPNETSWTVFKKVIDQRRQAKIPDIIIPLVNTSSRVRTMAYNVDKRVLDILNFWPLSITLNGSAWSEIPGKQSKCFFNIYGSYEFDLERLPRNGGYRIQFDGYLNYIDPVTGQYLIDNFTNPVTGKTNTLPKSDVGIDLVYKKDSFYTIDIPSSKSVGLLGAQGMEGQSDDQSEWSVNIISLIFPYSELNKIKSDSVNFFGTLGTFSSWPTWMEMADIPGNLVTKFTVSNDDFSQ